MPTHVPHESDIPHDTSDHILIEYARKDPRVFVELYDRYFPKIFRYVSWRVGNREDAEDIVSDVFMRALGNLDQFNERANATFSSWLFRIAHNRVIDHYRAHNKERLVALEDVPEIEDDALLPDALVEHQALFQEMRMHIDTLPPRQKEILLMRFFGEMRNKDIAEVLRIDERTVASALMRGLQTLRKHIGEQ